jgi:uncharacterized protein YijF (DUF1287 family)
VKKPRKVKRPKSKKRSARSRNANERTRAVPGVVAVSASATVRRTGAARASATAVTEREDRIALALLLAPFLIVALSLGVERAVRQFLVRAPQFIAAAQPPRPKSIAPPITTQPLPVAVQKPVASPPLPALALLKLLPPPLPSLALLELPPRPLPSLVLLELPPRPLPSLALLELPSPPLPSLALLELPPRPLPSLALLELPPSPLPSLALLRLPLPPLQTLALERPLAPLTVCVAASGVLGSRKSHISSRSFIPPRNPAAFGRALSDAARAQLRDFVIYNPKYIHIGYPMGDVPSLFGVCTDVVVRAYRQLGIDLQVLVQQTRSGTGDRNIDHRRVEVIRRFLARHGHVLPISEFAEDYRPGDIVTYYRPQNRSSTAHIAIVTDQLAPSGRPMIVHNRGWGPQLEDALFVDRITGHYRFAGLEADPAKKAPSAHANFRKEASIARGPRAQPTRQ